MMKGDLLLVPFPFSDQSGRKKRPVVVVSNDEFNEHSDDLIVVGVTSNISKNRYTLSLGNSDLIEGKLVTKCCIKCENILRIEKDLVLRKIGKLNNEKMQKISKIICEIVG